MKVLREYLLIGNEWWMVGIVWKNDTLLLIEVVGIWEDTYGYRAVVGKSDGLKDTDLFVIYKGLIMEMQNRFSMINGLMAFFLEFNMKQHFSFELKIEGYSTSSLHREDFSVF